MADQSPNALAQPRRKLFSIPRWLWWGAGCLAFIVIVFVGIQILPPPGAEPSLPVSGAPIADIVKRGEYLARVADCAPCHTSNASKPFAGGRAFATPFGTLYSTNITSDTQHGIGAWSDDDFLKAVREGIGADGNLYPAMPFTSYAAMSRDDVLAIKAYLNSLAPSSDANLAMGIPFPFNQRWSLKFWNLAFFNDRRYQIDRSQSVEWNRGAYLTNALGHCGECHTPRNIGFAVNEGRAFSGAQIEGWLAPNLTSDQSAGLISWSDNQLLAYLKTGHAEGRSSASGPMAEVVQHSLQHLSDADLKAMVLYLRTIPAKPGDAPNVAVMPKSVLASSSVLPAMEVVTSDAGFKIFAGDCAGCHLWNGRGRQSAYADLVGTRSVNDPAGSSVVQAILDGTEISINGQSAQMPGFRAKYSNDEIADLANYVLHHFGSKRGNVTSGSVAAQRNP